MQSPADLQKNRFAKWGLTQTHHHNETIKVLDALDFLALLVSLTIFMLFHADGSWQKVVLQKLLQVCCLQFLFVWSWLQFVVLEI